MVRRNKVRRAALALGTAVTLAACESPPSQQTMGAVIGTVAGGLIGSQIGGGSGRTVASVGGALVGGMLGNVIGKQMDDADRRKMSQAFEQNVQGQSTQWKNENTGASYKVTPKNTFARDGRECRTFEQEAIVDGQPRKMTGTACKRAYGDSWEVTT